MVGEAREPAASCLSSREELEQWVKVAGFRILAIEDETNAHLELARLRQQAVAVAPIGQMQANQVVLGPDFLERRKNYVQSLADGSISSLLIEALKP